MQGNRIVYCYKSMVNVQMKALSSKFSWEFLLFRVGGGAFDSDIWFGLQKKLQNVFCKTFFFFFCHLKIGKETLRMNNDFHITSPQLWLFIDYKQMTFIFNATASHLEL